MRLTVGVRVPPLDGVPETEEVPLQVTRRDRVTQADREGVRDAHELGEPEPERLDVTEALRLRGAEGPVVGVRDPRGDTDEDGVVRDENEGCTETDELRVDVSERDPLLVELCERLETPERVSLEVSVGLLLCVVDLE